jgi:general secretion pathway protein L
MKKAHPKQPSHKTAPSPSRKKWGKALKGFFLAGLADERLSYKKTLCLSIEKGGIGAAVGRRLFSQVRIQGTKFYPFPEKEYPPPEFAATCLSLAVAELGVIGCPLILSLPKEWTVIRTVAYPSTVMENPSQAIRYDLDRITPFSPETAYYDFKTLREEGSQVEWVVAAARMETVDPYLKALREKGFTVEGVTVHVLGLLALALFLRKSEPVLLLSLDQEGYEGVLYQSQRTLKAFSALFNGTDPQAVSETLIRELSLVTDETESALVPKTVLVQAKEVDPTLIDRLRLGLPWPILSLEPKDLGIREGLVSAKPFPYQAVGGLVESLWTKAEGLNLLRQGRHEKTKPPLVLTVLLLILLALLAGFYLFTPLELERKKLQEIERQIAVQKKELKKVEALKKEVEEIHREISLIRNFKTSHPMSLVVLKELTALLPKNTWLTRVRISENQVQLEGYSPSATFLIPRLDSSRYFKKVEFSAPTFRDPRQNMDRFQIKMELEGWGHEKE